MSAPSPIPTRRTPPTVVQKAAVDTSELSVSAVLTYPLTDLAGDVVVPSGLSFAPHRAAPWIDLEHGGECVGWARKSLSRPGGDYGVSWHTLDVDGGPARLPVGTTYFDPSDRLSMQVFRLVAEDALPGVSLEFRPVPGFMKSLGRSPLEPRDAYRFERADVVRWTHCATPVNSGALTVTKSVQQVPDRLAKILSDGRVGSEPLHPAVRKALSAYTPARRAVVRVEKAMDEQETVYDDAAPDAPDDDNGGDNGDEGGGQTSPTAQAAYDAAQQLTDACEALKAALGSSEHVAGKKKLLAACDQIEKLAAKFAATGDMIHDDVHGDDGGDMDEDDEEPELADGEMEPDEDGVIKALSDPRRRVYRKAVRRFTLAEVRKGHDPDGDRELEALRRQHIAELKKTKKVLARNR